MFNSIEQSIDLEWLLDKLPIRERSLLLLYLEGYTYDDIAKKIHRSPERVRQLIKRAENRIFILHNKQEICNPWKIKI